MDAPSRTKPGVPAPDYRNAHRAPVCRRNSYNCSRRYATGDGTLTIRLSRLTPVRGRVTFADGRPAAGASVTFTGQNFSLDGFRRTALTDEEVLATSDGPSGNTGFPSDREGRAHFLKMLKETRQRLTDDDLAAIEEAPKK